MTVKGERMALRAMQALCLLLGWLPYRAALILGWWLAVLSMPLARRNLRRGEARIRQVFGERFTVRQVRRIARRAWRNMFFNAVEMLRSPRMTLREARRITDLSDLNALTAALREGRNAVIAGPHVGSWELAGQTISLLGGAVVHPARNQKNRAMSEFMNHLRNRQGQLCLDRDDPALMRKLLRAMRGGRMLCILPDIRARGEGVPVRFLGLETRVEGGMAFLARLTGLPIIPCWALRRGWSRHRLVCRDPIYPDLSTGRDEDLRRMTQELMDLCSRIIMEYPDQYFWFNKKWLFDEPGATLAAARKA